MIDWREHYAEAGEEGTDQDYSNVDWALISTSVVNKEISYNFTNPHQFQFKGIRSPASLRLRWMNELSPRWSQEPWKKAELVKLKELRESVSEWI